MLLIYNSTKNIRPAFNEGEGEIYFHHLLFKYDVVTIYLSVYPVIFPLNLDFKQLID